MLLNSNYFSIEKLDTNFFVFEVGCISFYVSLEEAAVRALRH